MDEIHGLITLDDLKNYNSVWREPVRFHFDSLDIYSMPPPSSGGLIVGQILSLLEPFDLSLAGPNSADFVHLFCESSRLAFADRAVHLGDPDFWKVPDHLLDSVYLNLRRKKISTSSAGSSKEPTDSIPHESDQTTHFSVCDSQGNMVAITVTLNAPFGSKLVVNDAGFFLNNEMDDFSIRPGHANLYGLTGGEANKIEPGKRMLSSMSPTLVLKKGKPLMILGSRGGSKIITTIAQAIVNFSRFNLSAEEIVRQPRFHHQWQPDMIYIEENGLDFQTKEKLTAMGHKLKDRSAYGGLEMIMIDKSGLMKPVSDPRNEGAAAGY